MKISYIQNARIPTERAHGIQIMKTCEALVGLGHSVELTIPRRFNLIKENPFDYYGIDRIFKIRKLPCLDLIPLDKYLGHLGLWIESVSFLFFILLDTPFRKADIVYTRDKFLLPLSFFLKNFIYEAHTFPKNYLIYSLFLKKLKGMVVITQKLKDLFIEKGIPESRILVAADGVDLEKFGIKEAKEECRRKLNLPQDKKIVLYTGHLYKWKGAEVLLKAAPEIQSVLFVFVGGTKRDVADFKKHAEDLNNVLIVGHRPYAEMPYWLKSADVLVLPNSGKEEISKYWTSPMKMFEYMASRRPIVASGLPSVREILNETNAVLVEPDNPEALARGIKEILQNPQLPDKVSDRAFQDVQQYAWPERQKKILNFIHKEL
ncbi:MAG: glycosyltransferase family 4 protein [Candidatus Nealsonbacteria bacterium]